MDKASFARELVHIAERRCAERADWQKRFTEIRRGRRIAQWFLGICVFVVIGALLFVGGLKWEDLIEGIQEARMPRASFPLLGQLSIGCAGLAASFAGLARLCLMGSPQFGKTAYYPIADQDALMRDVRGMGILAGGFASLATAWVQFGLLGSHIHSWADGTLVFMLVVAQGLCVGSLTVLLAVSANRWIPSWLLLSSGLFAIVASFNDGLARSIAHWPYVGQMWLIAGFVPTTWSNFAFQSIFVGRNLFGVFWLTPIPVLIWGAFRRLRQDLQVLEYVSIRSGFEMPIFAETSPVARRTDYRPTLVVEKEVRITEGFAADALCKQFNCCDKPRSLLVGALLNRLSPESRMLTELGTPSVTRWRFPWVTTFVATSIASLLIWFIPYAESIRESQILVFQLSLCIAMTMGIANFTTFAKHTYWDPMGLRCFPVSYRRWMVARLRLLLWIAISSVAPIAVLLAVLQGILHGAPLAKTLGLGVMVVAFVAAALVLCACGQVLFRIQFSRSGALYLSAIVVGGFFGLSFVIYICETVLPYPLLPALIIAGFFIILVPILMIRMVQRWEVDLPG
jgi:hypothetical protein